MSLTEDGPPISTPPFSDLVAYTRLPRTGGLALSPDGARLVTAVSLLDERGGRSTTSLWEVDPTGQRPARRLTRGAKGESSPVFTPSGDLLFTSSRPDPAAAEGDGDDDAPAALWCLPAGGGEARKVAVRPGGVAGVVVARESGTVLLGSPTLPSATDAADDARLRKLRKDTRTSGVLHDALPVRIWDHDLGPDRNRLLVADGVPTAPVLAGTGGRSGSGKDRLDLRDLTGHVGAALPDDPAWTITADGSTVVTEWNVPEARGDSRVSLVAIDVATGERRTLLDDSSYRDGTSYDHTAPVAAPTGGRVAVLRWRRATPSKSMDVDIVVVDADGSESFVLADSQWWDRWPTSLAWTSDSSALLVTADDGGRCPVFRLDVSNDEVERLTPDEGAYSDVIASPDGQWIYAMRSAVDAPPTPVRIPAAGGEPEVLPAPAHALGAWGGDLPGGGPELPGTLTEVTATAADGTPLRAWLALPHGAGPDSPAPLLLWIHGGPLSSWNAWSWRWNPWLPVARGYAVLLPDPALSTGYGLDFIRRGLGRWGAEPYTDLMTITDAAVARDDVDAERTAAMGGSFGGYMANWVAGHTDRFRAIVTHASLWALDQFSGTTDFPAEWAREMTAEMVRDNSPHDHADAISTPMLVIHGDDDDRVPIGEALRLWYDLLSRSKAADGGAVSTSHRFLYFPDEGHWVLGAGNARLWYATVFAFLDQHVLGGPWIAPKELG
ncbi:Dipeptidyl aminopeptidase/acylaminoacyl peptidase [Quadrisphaera granulorum]|uniref:Dipeptidyl aminopeptidase/acylaminoacyl peptidase n=1 Tax=Quadrisphaera granulorum TaxID=317664 RepID=A0A316ADJ0_9ACTN|nr:alpha/beta fold hydrolase [Quadrisphaera granulorum]PWJ55825.1 dipeptidyl aminopeptidase/acylaminoacyl peptidase [Quadrisphaera granulorum]SZE95322.1 Dipeptidyl aminopeptidase/acylaminoacyl peptidase [Quadrisphaera granulorum]